MNPKQSSLLGPQRLASRIVILGLALLAIAVNSPSLTHRVLVSGLVQTLGGPVESRELILRPWQGTLQIERTAAVDPMNPARNLFQIERGEFLVDLPALVYRRLHLKQGNLAGVQLGTPRSGQNRIATGASHQNSLTTLDMADLRAWSADARRAAQRWLDQSPFDFTAADDGLNLNGQQLADQLQKEWQHRFDELDRRLRFFLGSDDCGQQRLDKPHPNPLPDTKKLQSLSGKLSETRQQTSAIAEEIESAKQALPSVAKQIQAVFSAPSLAPEPRRMPLESAMFAELLHTNEARQWLDQVLAVVEESLRQLPAIPHASRSATGGGRDVEFTGQRSLPSLVVETMEVDGSAWWAGQRLPFAGTMEQLTNDPARHAEPIRFQFRAQGTDHLVVSGTLDRRQGSESHTMTVRCPSVSLGASTLGDGSVLAVAVAPRRVQIELQLTSTAGKIAGQATLTYSDVVLHVDQIHDALGGSDLALRLNQRLGEINHFGTQIR